MSEDLEQPKNEGEDFIAPETSEEKGSSSEKIKELKDQLESVSDQKINLKRQERKLRRELRYEKCKKNGLSEVESYFDSLQGTAGPDPHERKDIEYEYGEKGIVALREDSDKEANEFYNFVLKYLTDNRSNIKVSSIYGKPMIVAPDMRIESLYGSNNRTDIHYGEKEHGVHRDRLAIYDPSIVKRLATDLEVEIEEEAK